LQFSLQAASPETFGYILVTQIPEGFVVSELILNARRPYMNRSRSVGKKNLIQHGEE
jgi:hypothetical protein